MKRGASWRQNCWRRRLKTSNMGLEVQNQLEIFTKPETQRLSGHTRVVIILTWKEGRFQCQRVSKYSREVKNVLQQQQQVGSDTWRSLILAAATAESMNTEPSASVLTTSCWGCARVGLYVRIVPTGNRFKRHSLAPVL